MRKSLILSSVFVILILSLGFVSASFFSDFWGKITGKATQIGCIDDFNCPDTEICFWEKCHLCPDINQDGIVDGLDKQIISEHIFETCSTPDWCEGTDLNKDELVDITDLTLLVQWMGQSCPEKVFCSDSDGGIDYFVKGIITKGDDSEEDSCVSSDILKEWFCDSNEISYEEYTCAGECVDGICVVVDETCGSVVLTDCVDPAEFVECREEYDAGSATEAEFLSCKEIFDTYVADNGGCVSLYGSYCTCGSVIGVECSDPAKAIECISQYEEGWADFNALLGCIQVCNLDSVCKEEIEFCSETDEGISYFIKGTTKKESVLGGAVSEDDVCISGDVLKEYYCDDNEINYKEYTCSKGCNAGKCEASLDCDDSDGGLNYFVKGSATKGSSTLTDICIKNILKEYYCDNNEISYEEYGCEYGCSKGTCLEESLCNDDDGGINYFVKGIIIKGENMEEDNCIDNDVLKEYYCDNNEISYEEYGCDYGCNSGACMVAEIENKKDMTKYSDKETFLISDLDWHEVLPLVPVTTWTQQEGVDEGDCQRGYETPDEVCAYPTLVFHAKDFIETVYNEPVTENPYNQDYPKISGDKIVWQDYRESNYEIYVYDLNSQIETKIADGQASRGDLDIDGDKVVWIDSETTSFDIHMYDLSTDEKTLIPIGSDYKTDISISGDKIAWIMGPFSGFDIYVYDLSTGEESRITDSPSLWKRKTSISGDKIVWGDSQDARIHVYDILTKEEDLILTGSKEGTAPFISGDKIVWDDYRDGNSDIYMYDLSTSQETRITSDPSTQAHSSISGDKIVWDDYRDGNSDIYMYNKDGIIIYHNGLDIDSPIYFMQQYSPSRVMISAENFESDCDDRIDNDGDEFIDDYDSDCELVGLLIVEPELGAGLDSSQIQRITPDNYLDYWESYGEVVCVEDDYELVLLGSTYASLINAPLVIEGNEPSGLDLVGKNVICIGSVSVNCDEQYTLEELQQKYVDETNTDKIMLVNPGDLDIKVDYEFQPEKSQGSIYEIYGKTSLVAPILASVKHEIIIPIGENTAEAINNLLETNAHEWGIEKGFLTVIGTPDAVESSIMMLSGGILQKAYADIMEYSILDDDKLFDLVPGRIFGISMSDVSSYISRVIFYNQLEKSDSIVSLATDFSVGIVSVKAYKQLFELISYDSSEIIGYDDERPFIITSEDYSDKFFIFYDDHGTGNWMGINAIQFPLLKNSLIFGLGCSTCYYRTYKSPYLVCAQSLRKGAIGYWGMIEGGGSINPQAFVSNIFTDKTLGEAYLASSSADFLNYGLLEIFNYLQKFGLIGDPTLKMNPSYILPYSEVNKIGEDTYEINLKVAPIPTELFSHEGSLNGEMRDITVPATVTPIFSSRTNDNSLVISYSKQYYRFDSYTQEVITEEKNNLKFAIKAGPIPLSREYTDIEVSGNFNGRASIEKEELIGGQKYVWVYLDNNNLAPTYDLPFTIPETGDLFETINFQFELI